MPTLQNFPKSIKDFKDLLIQAGVVDGSYPIPALVWLPYGVKIIEITSFFLRSLFRKYGFEEYIFPYLVSRQEFKKINNQIYNFDKGVFQISESMVLRPSGESAIYPMFNRWIKTTRDLPLRVFQMGAMFRSGRSGGLFRQNESDYFIEGHTAHASRQEAEAQLLKDNKIIRDWLGFMAVPTLQSERPFWTNKPVAERHIAFDGLLPAGEAILLGTSYAQMQVYSKVFDIAFSSDKGYKIYTYQTEFGFSHRVILVSLWLTSDNHGLCLLPQIAPEQVVIIEISIDKSRRVHKTVDEVYSKLKENFKVCQVPILGRHHSVTNFA